MVNKCSFRGCKEMTLQKKLFNVGNYRLTGKKLGKGNFAKVEEAVHAVLNVKVAIKIMDVTQIKEDYIIKNLHREARIMSQLHHPCIAALFQTMQNGNLYYLVTELIGGGDLCTFIKSQKYGKLDERSTRVYARQLISALGHMHNLGIVHRDLKMENVMMNSIQTQIKIVDFGLSNMYDPNSPLRTHCGSPEYAAPELFVPGKSYGPEVDLWSLGVILYGMVVGQLPFVTAREDSLSSQERRKRLLLQINKGYSTTQRKALAVASSDFRSMVARMLVADAIKRITVNELMFHPWITDKGKKSIVVNPWKILDDEWQISLMKQVGNLLQLDWTTVRYAINNEPQGDIAGIYNIFSYKLHTQQLEGDAVTKTLPSSHIPHYATPRSQTSNRKDSSTIVKVKKRIERVKSPSVHKVPKTSTETTPRAVPEKRAVADKRPQTTAGTTRARKAKETERIASAQQKPKTKNTSVSTDLRNRLQLAAERRQHVEMQWNFYNNRDQATPPPSEGSYKVVSIPPSIPKTRTSLSAAPRSGEKPRVQQTQAGTPSSSTAKNVKNEMQVVGSKGIAKVLSAKKKPSVGNAVRESTTTASPNSRSTRTTVGTAAVDRIKSKSDPVAYGRRAPSAPVMAATRPLRPLKRSRVIPVMGSASAPNKAVAASAPPAPQVRNRRVKASKPISNVVEQSPQVQGDAYKRRASTTPAKHVQIQRNILSDPIARSIAGYIVNNIPTRMDRFNWTKNRNKP